MQLVQRLPMCNTLASHWSSEWTNLEAVIPCCRSSTDFSLGAAR